MMRTATLSLCAGVLALALAQNKTPFVGMSLIKKGEVDGITRLRVAVANGSGNSPLCLRGIKVVTADKKEIAATASSSSRGSGDLRDLSTKDVNFCTAHRRENAWVDLKFNKPQNIRAVEIKNVHDHHRATGLDFGRLEFYGDNEKVLMKSIPFSRTLTPALFQGSFSHDFKGLYQDWRDADRAGAKQDQRYLFMTNSPSEIVQSFGVLEKLAATPNTKVMLIAAREEGVFGLNIGHINMLRRAGVPVDEFHTGGYRGLEEGLRDRMWNFLPDQIIVDFLWRAAIVAGWEMGVPVSFWYGNSGLFMRDWRFLHLPDQLPRDRYLLYTQKHKYPSWVAGSHLPQDEPLVHRYHVDNAKLTPWLANTKPFIINTNHHEVAGWVANTRPTSNKEVESVKHFFPESEKHKMLVYVALGTHTLIKPNGWAAMINDLNNLDRNKFRLVIMGGTKKAGKSSPIISLEGWKQAHFHGKENWGVILPSDSKEQKLAVESSSAPMVSFAGVPQLALFQAAKEMKRKMVFISHGGMSSTLEAAFNKVPVIGMPGCSEQSENVNVFQDFGVGIDLSQLSQQWYGDGIINDSGDNSPIVVRGPRARVSSLHAAVQYYDDDNNKMHYSQSQVKWTQRMNNDIYTTDQVIAVIKKVTESCRWPFGKKKPEDEEKAPAGENQKAEKKSEKKEGEKKSEKGEKKSEKKEVQKNGEKDATNKRKQTEDAQTESSKNKAAKKTASSAAKEKDARPASGKATISQQQLQSARSNTDKNQTVEKMERTEAASKEQSLCE